MIKDNKYRILLAWIYFLLLEFFFAWVGGNLSGWLISGLDMKDVETVSQIVTTSTLVMWLLGSFIAFCITYMTFFKHKPTVED
mgnify:CR=1 FL=1|jgi:hypothetical protein